MALSVFREGQRTKRKGESSADRLGEGGNVVGGPLGSGTCLEAEWLDSWRET